MSVTLGKLEIAELRDAWQNEAHHFTPWLAEHLDELGKVIGIPLELEGVEVLVGSFSADILARNALDDSLVLIENQLERTDHNHLGQIMTYLAGLGAQTIIWVAAEFREPHLSALKWLNEHTANPFAFFAIQVKVVRIGDSPLAPIFEIMERPNQWDRRVQESAKPALSASSEWRRAFWTRYIERFPEAKNFGEASALSNRWHLHERYDLVVSIYISKKGVGIYLRGRFGADGNAVGEVLAPYRACLSERIGSQAWNESRKGHYLLQYMLGDPADPAHWDLLGDWLHMMETRYTEALNACLGSVTLSIPMASDSDTNSEAELP